MELTGKCSIEFMKWYLSRKDLKVITWVWWRNAIPDSMKWGVLVDFFDCSGLNLSVYKDFNDVWIFSIEGNEHGDFDSRPEARKAAIEKAVELYNSNYETTRT